MITAILSWGSAILNLAKVLAPGDKSIEDSKDIVDKLGRFAGVINTGSAAKSASRMMIRPMVVVEQPLLHQEYMTDLMSIIQLRDVLNILTHLSMQGQVGGVKIGKLVDSINPSRAGMMSLSGLENFGGSNILLGVQGTEASIQKTDGETSSVSVDPKQVGSLTEYAPLALGRVVNAEVNIDGNKVTFPLVFRQIPTVADTKNIELVFEAARPQDGLKQRIMMLKTGEITPAQFLTGSDLIKEDYRIQRGDISGYYEEATSRANKNRLEAIRTGMASMNTMANAFVISSETARQIELSIGLRFSDPKARDRIFSRTVANTIVVCDDRRGVFTFYTHGSSRPEVYTRNEIKMKGNKDTNTSLPDLLKLLNGGV